jgi:hypothetical protein
MNESNYKQLLSDYNEQLSSQDILDAYGITEYCVGDLIADFETAMAYKEEQAKTFKILDAADHSDIWKVYNRKIPSYVQTPVVNPITIIKEATKASIMPTAYAGDYRPLTAAARQDAETANRFFQLKWGHAKMDEVNSEAADYAYLHGTSGVLFGWNDNIVDHSDVTAQFNPFKRSQIQAKAFHPSNIFPDPGAATVEEMRYLFFAERKSKDFLRTVPRFQAAMYAIDASNDSLGNTDPNYILDKMKQSGKDIVTFLTCYKKVIRVKQDPMTGMASMAPSVDIIYMAGRNILDVAKDIQPSCIPFVPLYDEKVPNNFWGISKCYKVLSLCLTLNMLDSTEATAYFKSQNPSEFINALAGINVAEYQRKRNNPDAAFTVNCDPKLVQAFAERPDLPKNIDSFRQYLITMIQEVSGVDAAYLGRSYGSIQTTGGVSQAIDRATMRDNNRINAIDKFIRKELELMTQFYIIHGQRENFFPIMNNNRQQQLGNEMQFDPTTLISRDDIEINVSNCAPRSNASYEEAAMKLFELQMKYQPSQNGYPDLITPEELVGWLNIANSQKNVLIDRMRAQLTNMKLEEYTAVVTALGTLTQGGMTPEDALAEIAKMIEQSDMGQLPASNVTPGQPMTK